MRRREFIGVALAGTLTALPPSARAQQPLHTPDHWPKRHYSIAVISPAAPLSRMTETSPNLFFREFFLEIRRRGYVEGENLHVHRFSTEGNPQRTPEVIQQAIQSQPDAIFAFSSRLVKALKDATTTVPV